MSDAVTTNPGPTPAGFHFYNLYQCCPYKFYLRNVRGLDTESRSAALIRGDAVHQALEKLYESGNLDEAVELGKRIIEAANLEFYDDVTYEKELTNVEEMIASWAQSYGVADFETYENFALEQELELPLGDGKRVTVRIDKIGFRSDRSSVDLFDYKTTTFSKDNTERGFAWSDQPTLYIAAVKKVLGLEVEAIYCDILYKHSRAKAPQPWRGMPVTRSDLEVTQALESVKATFLEIDRKVSDVTEQRTAPHEAFPRNTYYCNAYFRLCEFAPVCRLSNGMDEEIPLKPGIVQGEKMKALGSYTSDALGVMP